MIKQPLFGQDSSPHKTSTFLSAIITFVLWLAMIITGALIKIKPVAPKYKEVQIVLSSEKHDQNQESASAAAPAPAVPENESVVPENESVVPEPVEGPQVEEVVVPEPAPAPKVEPPSTSSGTPKSTPKKTEPAKTQTTPKKTEAPAKTTDPSKKVNFDDYQYATDYSDFDFSNVSSTKKTTWDDSMFDDASSEPEVKISQKVDKVTTSSTIQGSAASTATQKTQSQTSAQSKSQNTTPAASSSTSSMLSNIKNTQYSTSTGSSTKTITEAKTTKGSDGTLSMAMTDGSTRILLNPVPPTIKLSESAASLIETTRTVTIEFQVLTSGNVPRAQVKISPESILPQAVRDEIYDQLSSWLFESSSSSARATFEYTIVKQ